MTTKTEKTYRYEVCECSPMDRSWIRNSETGEDRPECLRVLYYTNSIDRADAWIVDNEKTIDLGNMLLIWDNESPKWDQYVDNSLVHGAA